MKVVYTISLDVAAKDPSAKQKILNAPFVRIFDTLYKTWWDPQGSMTVKEDQAAIYRGDRALDFFKNDDDDAHIVFELLEHRIESIASDVEGSSYTEQLLEKLKEQFSHSQKYWKDQFIKDGNNIGDLRRQLDAAKEEIARLSSENEANRKAFTRACEQRDQQIDRVIKLEGFKQYVHNRLDQGGVPVDPESPHQKEGCRIGGRLDWVFARLHDSNYDYASMARRLKEELTMLLKVYISLRFKVGLGLADNTIIRHIRTVIGSLPNPVADSASLAGEPTAGQEALQQELAALKAEKEDNLKNRQGLQEDVRQLREQLKAKQTQEPYLALDRYGKDLQRGAEVFVQTIFNVSPEDEQGWSGHLVGVSQTGFLLVEDEHRAITPVLSSVVSEV